MGGWVFLVGDCQTYGVEAGRDSGAQYIPLANHSTRGAAPKPASKDAVGLIMLRGAGAGRIRRGVSSNGNAERESPHSTDSVGKVW